MTFARLQISVEDPVATMKGVQVAKRSFDTTEDLSVKDGYRYEQHVTHDLSKTEETKPLHQEFAARSRTKGG